MQNNFTYKRLLSAVLGLSLSISATGSAIAQTTNVLPPDGAANKTFGKAIAMLPNGNIVVTDPKASNGAVSEAGAVYLINGTTFQVISTLRGSTANDHVGGDGITVLKNGNFVVTSTEWDNGSYTNAGAVTWGSSASGVSGTVSSTNSMVGAATNDLIGIGGVTPLANGNYVICSFCWHNGANYNAGAITWCNGTSASSGLVGPSNSLCASAINDALGNIGIRELSNGNYIVGCLYWDNGSATDAGATTWCSGTIGRSGFISSSNSLVGTHAGDMIGQIVVPLQNGNYVTGGVDWQNGTVDEAGAIIWCDGSVGRTGAVTASIALVGSTFGDKVGNMFITPLSNGDYVVTSPMWQNGAAGAVGAMTRCNGTTGTTGAVSSSNSLIGNSAADGIGYGQIIPLTNGNFVLANAGWSSPTHQQAGMAMFFGPGQPCIGYFNSANALVGNSDYATVGSDVIPLSNGNYVVASPQWAAGYNSGQGAVTWCSGTTGLSGTISATNSLVGANNDDQVGSKVIALSNGNYVVTSPQWSNDSQSYVGATTWCDGATGRTGYVTSLNSITGTSNYEMLGQTVAALTNGNYVVSSTNWNSPTITAAGAVRVVNGTTMVAGHLTASNSITGSTAWDNVGRDIIALADGNFIIRSDNFNNGPTGGAGAQTLGSGTASVAATVSSCNSVVGTTAWSGSQQKTDYNATTGTMVVGRPADNLVTVFKPVPNGIVQANGTASAYLAGNPTRTEFIEPASCRVVAALKPSGAAPVSGDVSTKALVRGTAATFNGQAYVRRSFDITPSENASTATGRITLYLTQADIDDYNANNGSDPDLPAAANDLTGIANLRVTQQHGTSATGAPGSYSGYTGSGAKNIVIDPADGDIVYNSSLSRWEISFDVTGFSGFFIHGGTNATPLNLQLLQFGAAAAGTENQVSWTMANAAAAGSFSLEHSANGKDFDMLGIIRPETERTSYQFSDRNPYTTTYYRLKYTDLANHTFYSNVAAVRRSRSEAGIFVSPVPADRNVNVSVSDPALIGTAARVINMNGQLMQTLTLNAVNTLEIQSWPSGIYTLHMADGRTMRIVRQ